MVAALLPATGREGVHFIKPIVIEDVTYNILLF